MLVLGLDIETTGLSPIDNRIIELGAVVWDTSTNRPIAMLNHLISIGGDTLPERITDLTGLCDSDLKNFGIDELKALEQLMYFAEKCEYIVAHNGNRFDKKFIEQALSKYGLLLDKPWIDTLYDVPYPDEVKSRRLTNLAKQHGCELAFAHRAQFDVLAMLQICANYNWQNIIELQQVPLVTLVAQVGYDDRQLAKDAGFYFDRNTKQWLKNIKQNQVDELCLSFEFTII